MVEDIIDIQGVHVTLPSDAGKVHILKGIDLKVRSGESVAVVGPSGSGKTTLLMVVAGLEGASEGRVHVAGHDLGRLGEDALAVFRRDHIGIVFQAFHLIATMTALENVSVPLELAGVENAEQIARDELAAVGLAHRFTHYPGQLSGGEQQRVALARALAPGPSVVLADEPTGNLDSGTGAEVVDIMFRLQRERGTTLVLVTHDAVLAARTGRMLRVSDGRITEDVANSPPRESVA